MTLDPVSQFNLVTIIGVIVVFVIALLVLRKTFFGPVIAVIERRDAKVEKGRRIRDEAARLVSDAQAEAERIGAEAATARKDAVSAIRADIATAREARLVEATAEADAIAAAGRVEVDALRESERGRMHESLTGCVIETLSSLLDEVDERRVRALVDQELAARAAPARPEEEQTAEQASTAAEPAEPAQMQEAAS